MSEKDFYLHIIRLVDKHIREDSEIRLRFHMGLVHDIQRAVENDVPAVWTEDENESDL